MPSPSREHSSGSQSERTEDCRSNNPLIKSFVAFIKQGPTGLQTEIQGVINCMSLDNYESYLSYFIEYLKANKNSFDDFKIKQYAINLRSCINNYIVENSTECNVSLIKKNLSKTLKELDLLTL